MPVVEQSTTFVRQRRRASKKPTPSPFLASRVLLITALVSAPWAFGAIAPWAWTSLGLISCLSLFLWALASVRRGVAEPAWSPLYIPLALFFLLGTAQYYRHLTLDTSETRLALMMLGIDLVLFFVSVQVFSEAGSEAWSRFGYLILVFTVSIGLFSILQFASGTTRIYWVFDTTGLPFGPYSNPDHYAALMEMAIPVAVGYIAERRQREFETSLLLPVLAVTVAIASLLLSGSRGGLLSGSVELLIAVVILRRFIEGKPRWTLAGIAAAVLLASILLFSWLDPGWAAAKLGSIIDVQGQAWITATEFRRNLIKDSIHMLREHPLSGVGLGNFETAYPPYQSFPSDLTIDFAHNDYMQAFAETGLIGAGLILAAILLFLRLAFGDCRQKLRSGHGWIQLGATLGCCGLLVHSLVDFNLHIPANSAWFAVLAGMSVTRRRSLTSSLPLCDR